jgi:DNA-directed RNA polymerase specialized sigma24 family protein
MKELCRTEICILIDEWIVGRNAERDRAILKRRLVDGLTYERLAEEFDMSVRQISNIIYKRQDVLFRHMPLG